MAKSSLGKYLFDRVVRVYVTLIPSLIFVVIADFILKIISINGIDQSVSYTGINILISNIFLIPEMPYGTMRPIWSLMYEWWIYMLFGGVFFLGSNKIPALLLTLAGAYYTIKVNAAGEAGHIWIIWALGGGCAYLQRRISWQSLNHHWLGVLSLFLLLVSGWFYFSSKSAYNMVAGVFLALFIFVFTSKSSGFWKLLPRFEVVAKKLAGFSFTLFLTHYTVLTYTKEFLKLDGWTGLIVGFIISNLIAFLIALFTEYNLTNIKSFLSRAGQSLRASLR